MQRIYAHASVSISDLKKNLSKIINQVQCEPVAILDHNRVTAYLVSAATLEAMLERIDDNDLCSLVRARRNEPIEFATKDLDH
jgi:antitoxin StbD